MNTSDALTLAEYNRWANGRVLRRATHLTPEQLSAPCWLSQGNLFRTLIHMIDAQWFWRSACQAGKAPSAELTEEQLPDIQSLRAYFEKEDELLVAFIRSLTDEQVNGEVQYSWSTARPRVRPLWHILMHVINHGTHHRSEIGQYLGTLGRSPGNLDFLIYVSKDRSQS